IHRNITVPPAPAPTENLIEDSYLPKLSVAYAAQYNFIPGLCTTIHTVSINNLNSLPRKWFTTGHEGDKYFVSIDLEGIYGAGIYKGHFGCELKVTAATT